MADHSVVKNYGWIDAEKTCAHGYLEPAILRICKNYRFNRILDLGCGNGALCGTLADAGFTVVGCDADAKGIVIARNKNPALSFHKVGVYDNPESIGASSFDAVVSTEVVEHLLLPRSLPKFAHAVLKPAGYLVITTPYHGYLKNLALTLLGKWDRHHDPLWDGGHVKFWSRMTLTRLLESEGFDVKEFRGIGRLPYLWKSMMLVAQKR